MNNVKKIGFQLLLMLGALVLQQTLIRWLAFGAVRPDLTLIALTVFVLKYGPI